MRNREQHLEWAKHRARNHLMAGNVALAVNSMIEDLAAHPSTESLGVALAPIGMQHAAANDLESARLWIEGFI
jgi:hypothetical protein